MLWLNETQVFLRDPRAAAALRRVLAGRDPVVMIGTMWPQYWKELTARPSDASPDPNHHARQLFQSAERVEVPEKFAGPDLAELQRQLDIDRRLEIAAAVAGGDGKVMQVLAGGPELVRHYEHPADAEERIGKAVIMADTSHPSGGASSRRSLRCT